MAVSGSKSYSITAIEVIGAALRKLGVYDSGETIPAEETQDALLALNVLIKEWSAQGIDIWLRQEITLFVQGGGKTTYTLSPTGDLATTDTVFETELDVASNGVDANIRTAEQPGSASYAAVVMDDNSVEVRDVTGITGNGFLASPAIPAGASVGNKVYSFDNKVSKPLKIVFAMRRNSDGQDVPIDLIGENEYQRLSDKDQTGPTTQVWYKPLRDSGELRIWPIGESNFHRIIMQAHFHPDDFDATTNEPEFPIEWANALIFGLAHDLAPEYGISRQDRADLYAIGQRKLNDLLDWDQENASVIFTIDDRGRGGR